MVSNMKTNTSPFSSHADFSKVEGGTEIDYSTIMEMAGKYVVNTKPAMQCPADVYEFVHPMFIGKTQEEMMVLHVDSRSHLIKFEIVCIGLVDQCQLHVREIFRNAIINNAKHIIICHNHPSGDPSPSSHDIEFTRGLVAAGKIIGIEIRDHIIAGEKTPERLYGFLSFKEANLL